MFFDYCGNKIYYEDFNISQKKEPETIVFLHGWGCDSRVFYALARSLSKGYRCVLVDFPGCGKSEMPKGGIHIETQANMIKSLCNFLMVKKFHLLSHSYGGRVSISLLSDGDSRIISALLVSPAGVKVASLKLGIKVLIFKIRKKLSKNKNSKRLEKYYSIDYRNSCGAMRETLKLATGYDQTFQLGEIHAKVLIVRGKKDTAVSKKMMKKMKKRIENCTYKEIYGDHFAFLQSGIEFQMLVDNFFS